MSDLDTQKIEQLVASAQAGNQKSFETLFEYFFEKIYRYVRFRVSNESVDDIVGDVFLKVVQSLDRYTPQEGAHFSSWVFRIAHNTVVDFYRKEKEYVSLYDEEGEVIVPLLDSEPTPDIQADDMYNALKIQKLLKDLHPNYREVLELKYVEEFSTREISEILGKTEGNIRVIQLRALKALKNAWEESQLH